MNPNISEHVARVVAEAPPLTHERRERITALLRGSDPASLSSMWSDEALAQEREEERRRQDALDEAKKLCRELMACDMCNRPPEAHNAWDHKWQPGRAARIMQDRQG
jgi:hypothetical protein